MSRKALWGWPGERLVGNGWNIVLRVLFRKRENSLSSAAKLGEFALAHKLYARNSLSSLTGTQ